jgi:hypothetical protein
MGVYEEKQHVKKYVEDDDEKETVAPDVLEYM